MLRWPSSLRERRARRFEGRPSEASIPARRAATDRPYPRNTRRKRSERKALEAEHRRDHETIAAISRKGKLVIATHSGHHIQLDEPQLVIESIREVLEAMRK